MLNILVVGMGGFIGSVARYLTYILVRLHLPVLFPLATLLVNLIGCFLLGIVSGMAERQPFHPQVMLMLTVGVIGGFTTFSAFEMDTITLLKDGELNTALLNVGINLISGMGAVWLGHRMLMNIV